TSASEVGLLRFYVDIDRTWSILVSVKGEKVAGIRERDAGSRFRIRKGRVPAEETKRVGDGDRTAKRRHPWCREVRMIVQGMNGRLHMEQSLFVQVEDIWCVQQHQGDGCFSAREEMNAPSEF